MHQMYYHANHWPILSGMTVLLNMTIITNHNYRSGSFRITSMTAPNCITYGRRPARTQRINTCTISSPRASQNTVVNYQKPVDNFGLIVHGCCLLIPPSMRPMVPTNLHESHKGSVHMKDRVRLSLYWHGIDMSFYCARNVRLPSNCKEPIISKPKPSPALSRGCHGLL